MDVKAINSCKKGDSLYEPGSRSLLDILAHALSYLRGRTHELIKDGSNLCTQMNLPKTKNPLTQRVRFNEVLQLSI